MFILARKISTFRRVAAERGLVGLLGAAEHHANRVPAYRRLRHLARIAAVGPNALSARWEHGSPRILLKYFGGIGDELLMTGVLRELRVRDYPDVWMLSEFTDLWRHNRDPDRVLSWDRRYDPWIGRFGWDVVRPWYSRYLPESDRDSPPPQHILTTMCQRVGIVGPIGRRPYLTLTDEERATGERVPNQIVIQSAGLDAHFAMNTKQWYPERYQEVVSALKGDLNFVQVGSRLDPPLDGALDLRGKTSIRETAAIMSRSLAFVGQVGMPMHLARAVDCPAVIVYGGREHPSQTGYSCNENVYSPVHCSPCWHLNTCEYSMTCMRDVSAADVIRGVERQVARAGQPLAVDTDVVTTDGVPMRTTPDGRTMLTITDVFGDHRELEAKFASY